MIQIQTSNYLFSHSNFRRNLNVSKLFIFASREPRNQCVRLLQPWLKVSYRLQRSLLVLIHHLAQHTKPVSDLGICFDLFFQWWLGSTKLSECSYSAPLINHYHTLPGSKKGFGEEVYWHRLSVVIIVWSKVLTMTIVSKMLILTKKYYKYPGPRKELKATKRVKIKIHISFLPQALKMCPWYPQYVWGFD